MQHQFHEFFFLNGMLQKCAPCQHIAICNWNICVCKKLLIIRESWRCTMHNEHFWFENRKFNFQKWEKWKNLNSIFCTFIYYYTLCQMHRKHFSNLWMLLVVGRMAWKSTNFAIFADLLYRSTRCIFKYGYLKFFAQLCTGQIQLLPLHMMPRDAPKLNPLRDMVFLCSKSV